MIELIKFKNINVVPKEDIQVVSSICTSVNQETGTPLYIILKTALNKHIAEAENCEFPIYLPAQFNYHSDNHIKLLDIFRSGEAFVAVRCKNLKIYREKINEGYKYWGNADSFQVINALGDYLC